MAELVRARQGAARQNSIFASAGVGGLPHLAGELFKLTAKIDVVHVPYRGAAPAINDLLGQQVQMTFLDLPVIPAAHQGRVAGGRSRLAHLRAPADPRPTCRPRPKVGMPDLLIENWYGMIAPGGTPPAIVASLNRIATRGDRRSGGEKKDLPIRA